jgi:glycosyltransferase involved in cell wall biosynthesis
MMRRARTRRKPGVLIIVQNLPVPLDRRVWLECQALVGAGYGVSVICPKGPGDPSYEEIEGVRLYKYAPPPAARGALGYLVEFLYCWLRTAALSLRVLRRDGFDVIQACNPPDTYWALAAIYKRLGKKFVFDHHDLNPEVYSSRFGKPRSPLARLQYRALLALERRTFATADLVISTNESYKQIAVSRGRRDPSDVTVVRSGPSAAAMRPIDGIPDLRRGREHLLVYLGIMGPQDGVDLVLRMMDVLVNRWNRQDVQVALLGFGDSYDELVALSEEFGLTEHVTFTGRVGPAEITEYLSTAVIGLSPDPLNPLNDVSTMNKTMEYMSFALPVVAFDLTETRVSGGDAVEYIPAAAVVDDAVVEQFAVGVVKLLEDPQRRAEMALVGRRRAETVLDWQPQREAYLSVFDRLTGHRSVLRTDVASGSHVPVDARLVDVADDAELRAFAVHRSLADVDAARDPERGELEDSQVA